MHVAPPTPDLRERARQRIEDALSGGRALSVAEIPRSWPVTRTLMRAIARQMLDEGTLVRVPRPPRGGPERLALASRPRATPRRAKRPRTFLREAVPCAPDSRR